MKDMSTYTHPHVIPKLNAFLSLAQKEDILKNIDNQTVVMSIDFSIDFMDRKIHETFLKISVMFHRRNTDLEIQHEGE